MNQEARGLENLQIWQKSLEFARMICKDVIPLLPVEEKWALAQQLRRSVQSIPANIAEGYGRYHYLENVRFCYIARGSLEETFSHLTLAHQPGYIPDDRKAELESLMRRLKQMLNGYIQFLKKSKTGENELPNPHAFREEPEIYQADLVPDNEWPDHESPPHE